VIAQILSQLASTPSLQAQMISHDGLRALLEHSVPQASMQVQQVCDTNVPAIAVGAMYDLAVSRFE